MSYVTPQQMAQGSGALRELAQLFELDEALLAATLAGEDRAAWSADEQVDADLAVATIDETAIRATGEIDAYLVPRGYTLPMDAESYPVLRTWARNITRYHLSLQRDLQDDATARIERDYKNTLNGLMLLAKGDIGLGANDPLFGAGKASSGSPQVDPAAPDRVFTRDSLRGF